MNCNQVRGYLLQTERLAQPGAAVESHLVDCRDCSQWRQRLLEIEQTVVALPVPASSGPGEFLARLAAEPVPSARRVIRVRDHSTGLGRWLGSPALGPAGLAASLLLFAFVWWMLQGKREPQVTQATAARKAPVPDQLL